MNDRSKQPHSDSGYRREEPRQDRPRPHRPGEGSPHGPQNDPKRKPNVDPEKDGRPD